MARDPGAELPLKANMFEILLALHDGEQHGYSLVKRLRRAPAGGRLQPANLYRTLRTMLERQLIEQAETRADPAVDDQRRRYFRLTGFGRQVARAEARRLDLMVGDARRHRLLADPESTS